MLRCNFCVGVGDVGGEIRRAIITVEGLTGGVLPGTGEGILCSDEFEGGASGEACQTETVVEHVLHIRHVLRIQRC